MTRLSPPGAMRFAQAMPGSMEVTFAGAEVNVAVALAQLGAPAAFVTALPRHQVADAVVSHLQGLGVDTSGIVRSGEGRLGLFFLEQGSGPRPARVIYDRAGSSVSILPASTYDWDAVFAGASWFHLSGITPAISANAATVAEHAVHFAAARGIPVSLDVNFRHALWQWEPGTAPRDLAARTLQRLMPSVTLLFAGPDDIAILTGQAVAPDSPDRGASAIAARWPQVTRVACTLRESLSACHHRLGGILWESAAESPFFAPAPLDATRRYELHPIVDRLGGGDAFAAGLIFALTTPGLEKPEVAVTFATAASCLAHTIPGDFARLRRDEVEDLLRSGTAGRVQR